MSRHRLAPSRRLRPDTALRFGFALLALVSAVALMLPLAQAPAVAADDSDSAITVAWNGDSSSAASYQPSRSASSPHYSRMKNISVTVDQTENLVDEAVRVHVAGFAATDSFADYAGYLPSNAVNFVQAMQCWGDPSSATFYQTCQWGGRFGSNAGVGNLVESDTLLRVANANLRNTTGAEPATDPLDVPFKSVDGSLTSGRQTVTTTGGVSSTTTPLFSIFSPTSTNEVPGARIDSDGTGSFEFEVQNSDSAPQLGCGTAAHLRCWLVVVPRDDVWGGGKPGSTGTCSSLLDANLDTPAYGSTGTPQAGSPVNPACDYWDNRVVVPLNFTPTGVTCPSGSTERRTVGSDLLVSAMSSWQPALCTSAKTNYSFDTNPDLLSRSQLVEGKVGLAFTPGPVVAGDLSSGDATTLASTSISYAPVAATSAVIAFSADGRSGRITSLHLTPRLVAKLLTQSYVFTVPTEASNPTLDVAHLPAVNRSYTHWYQDPDFQAANANWKDFVSDPAIVLPGPYAADVIAQLWKWIDGDADAKAWLNGAADPWGMTVNPYYRALGDPLAVVPTFDSSANPITQNGVAVTKAVGLTNLDGTPLKLGDTPLNSFIKADGSLVPLDLTSTGARYAFGSIQASPYAQDFLSGTKATFRANPGAKVQWDPTVVDDAGESGAWVSPGQQVVGQRFTLSFTDAASASQFDLDTASLSLDGQPTVFTDPTDAAVTAAISSSALVPTSVAAVSAVDPTKVSTGQYPLSTLVYAAVNLTTTDAAARADYATLISSITTTGQTPGSAVGELPDGYVPLPSTFVTQAGAAATAIRSYVASDDSGDEGDSGGFASASSSSSSAADGASAPGDAASPSVGQVDAVQIGRTGAVSSEPVLRTALLAALLAGVGGALVSPLLLRRRRVR